jgi:hypothetical protein
MSRRRPGDDARTPIFEPLETRILLDAALPELPRVRVDTTYTAPTGIVRNVDASYGGNLQNALNAAQPGDVVELTAGKTYQNTTGFRLPVKTNPNGKYIIVRTSAWASLPVEGTRAGAAQAGLMAKIADTSASGADSALRADNQASYWRLVGIEVYRTASYTDGSIIDLGTLSLNSVSLQPNHIIIDRCYIHGFSNTEVRRGVSVQGPYMAIIDSTISGIQHSSEPQAILGGNGPGPYRFANNFLEASGENVMFGGFDTAVANLVPSDIEFVHNLVSKQTAWRGSAYTVKNLFELKSAQRVLIEGNIFENTWAAAQYFAIVLTPRNQNGTNPWNTVLDITFRDNIVRHVSAGINILGRDDAHVSLATRRLLIENNLFYDVGQTYGGDGRMIQLLSNNNVLMTDVTIRHNTQIFSTGGNLLVSIDGSAPIIDRIDYVNNIGSHGTYGIKGSGMATGLSSINYFLTNWTMTHNAFLDGGSAGVYPPGQWFYTTAQAKFTNAAAGDYSLLATSPLKNAGTDGRDVGVYGAELAYLTRGVPEGVTWVLHPGDANYDGKVDGADLALWQQHYDAVGAHTNTWDMGDWNKDGRIDGGDLALWQQNYNPIGIKDAGEPQPSRLSGPDASPAVPASGTSTTEEVRTSIDANTLTAAPQATAAAPVTESSETLGLVRLEDELGSKVAPVGTPSDTSATADAGATLASSVMTRDRLLVSEPLGVVVPGTPAVRLSTVNPATELLTDGFYAERSLLAGRVHGLVSGWHSATGDESEDVFGLLEPLLPLTAAAR